MVWIDTVFILLINDWKVQIVGLGEKTEGPGFNHFGVAHTGYGELFYEKGRRQNDLLRNTKAEIA